MVCLSKVGRNLDLFRERKVSLRSGSQEKRIDEVILKFVPVYEIKKRAACLCLMLGPRRTGGTKLSSRL
jgi:hypothetical protein